MQLVRGQLSDGLLIHIHVVAGLAVSSNYELASALSKICYHQQHILQEHYATVRLKLTHNS